MKRIILISIMPIMLVNIAISGWVYEGQWGSYGSGYGQFNYPPGIAVPSNYKAYVVDTKNHRVQYFRYEPAQNITPTSLGNVKALFK